MFKNTLWDSLYTVKQRYDPGDAASVNLNCWFPNGSLVKLYISGWTYVRLRVDGGTPEGGQWYAGGWMKVRQRVHEGALEGRLAPTRGRPGAHQGGSFAHLRGPSSPT